MSKKKLITTERKAHRHTIEQAVLQPAARAALYRGAWVTGIAVVFVSLIYGRFWLMVPAAVLIGVGWGGDNALQRNWKIFRDDILGIVLVDTEEDIEDTGPMLRPMTKNTNPNQPTYTQGKFKFTRSQWQAFAKAVQGNRERINTSTIRAAGIFQNAAADGMKYVNEFKRIGWVDDEGLITDTGYNWLIDNGIMSPHSTDD